MPHTQLQIETADGHCPTHAYHPSGTGPWPGAIMYMDGIGMRPALMEIAERIATNGYYVLLPNLFYRVEFDASHGMKVFTDPDLRRDLMTRVMPSASAANVMRDTEALFAHLYVAGAIRDPNFDDAQRARLEQALTDSGVDHMIETYNALHGFVPRDTPVHDEAATARHWGTLLALFAETLKPGAPQ